MLIWSGYGFVVPIALFCSLLASEAGIEALYNDENYYQAHGWPKLIGFLTGAVIILLFWLLAGDGGSRTLLDPKTREKVHIGGSHTFFFVPIKWWPVISVGLGFIFLFVVE